MKKKTVFLLALSVILLTATTVNSTLAYFTSYAEAKGGYIITLGDTDIEEDFYAWTKKVVITNSNDGQPVYVRARAFAGEGYSLVYSSEDGSWTLGEDGYYYYQVDPLDPWAGIVWGGQSTSALLIKIDNVPYEPKVGDSFNVIVVYETTPVDFDENGNPSADWSAVREGGNEY